jgi:hypothetical protein
VIDMHRQTLAALIVFLGMAGTTPAASWADLLFQETSKDFGSVPRGPAQQHSFVIRNTTSDPVRISLLRVSCGCVVASIDRNVLQPGEESAIVARMDTTRVKGIKTVTIFVHFDQPRSEEVRLWLRANARDDVVVTPETLAFGQIKRGGSPATSVRILFQADGRTRITEVQAESNYIQAAVRELTRQPNEVVYELTARLRPDAPVGRWFTDVWLKTDNASMPRVRVPLTVEIESTLNVSPALVSLGELKVGQEVERKVIVRGVKPFRVVGVRGTDAVLRVRDSADASKPVHVLTIVYKAAQAGEFQRALEILTDLDGAASIDVQTAGRVTP